MAADLNGPDCEIGGKRKTTKLFVLMTLQNAIKEADYQFIIVRR